MPTQVVHVNFARKLERERDEAREKLRMTNIESNARQEISSALKERDEAREKYDLESVEHMLAINKICGERDEARRESIQNLNGGIKKMNHDSILFIYTKEGKVACFEAEEIRGKEIQMSMQGWTHTATINPARWIEAMANGNTDPSDMLDELQMIL